MSAILVSLRMHSETETIQLIKICSQIFLASVSNKFGYSSWIWGLQGTKLHKYFFVGSKVEIDCYQPPKYGSNFKLMLIVCGIWKDLRNRKPHQNPSINKRVTSILVIFFYFGSQSVPCLLRKITKIAITCLFMDRFWCGFRFLKSFQIPHTMSMSLKFEPYFGCW